MTSTTTTALETPITPAFSTVSMQDPPIMVESEMHCEPERPALEATSNVRQGSRTPEPLSVNFQEALLFRRPRDFVIDDPVFSLPPPDLAPRFVFRADGPYIEDTAPPLMSDDSLDTAPPIQTPIYTPSSSPPRIYFGPSAITFIPPVSYDFLERDPKAKGVPRNYRAWARAGRPKLDLEGAERPDAKSDFRAIGLTFPQDSDEEDEGDVEGDTEKKKKKRKKKHTAKAMVPIDRPRRTVRKLMETAPPATPPLQSMPTNEKEREVKPKPMAVIHTVDEVKKGPNSKSADESDSSGRRSSSTLLDTDVADTSKRKRPDLDKDINDVPAEKRLRVSKRLHAKKYGPKDGSTSGQSASEEEEGNAHSPLSDLTPSPVSPEIPARRAAALTSEGRRRSSPSSCSTPKTRTASGQLTKPAVANLSRSAPLPASRPGHRLSRDVLPNPSQAVPTRTFPPSLPIIPGYSGFYRRYPLVTQFHFDDAAGMHITPNDTQPKRTLGNWNPPRDHRDLYTPRYTKGSGGKKIALCPICFEEPARGGEGRQEWNHTKTSQHNYHMQYYHGISATRCAPFSPPTAQRISPVLRPQTNEKSQILQGKCHVCQQWVALEGCKVGELKVKELLWWKHAAQCHKDSKLPGEEDIFIEDDAFRRLNEYEAAHPHQS